MNEKKKENLEIEEKLKNFKHCTEGQVQFYEVDSYKVVHNVRYLYWLEWARSLYFNKLGVELSDRTFTQHLPIMVVRNEIDYLNPLFCFDKYKVYTRVSAIKNSSFTMENIICSEKNEINAIAKVVFVFLDKKTMKKASIPDNVRKMFNDFEKQENIA